MKNDEQARLEVDFSMTTADAAGTETEGPEDHLGHFSTLTVYADLTGPTGGTLDVYLQVEVGGTWVDWLHFAQVAAAGSLTVAIVLNRGTPSSDFTAVGSGSSPALAAGAFLGGGWTDRMRALFVSGVGTSAGAAQVLKLTFGE